MNPLGIVCALAAIAIYAGMFAVGRSGAASGLNGFDQTALRFAFSGIAVLPLTLWFGRSALIKLGWAKLLGLVVLGGSVYSAVFLSGLVFAPVAFGAALVPGLQPIAVLILSSVLFSEQVTPRKLAGPAVCLVGLMVMMIASSAVMKPGYSIGIALFVSAAAMWGAYAVALKAWSVEPMEALAMTAPLSALVFLPVYMSIRGLAPILDAPLSASLLQVAYQGVLVGIAAVFLYASAVKISGSIAVSSLSPAMPVLAIMIGWWLLGEQPTTLQSIGVSIVSLGLLVGALLASSPGKNAIVTTRAKS